MPVITISKEFGAESEILARRVADRLGYALLDKEIASDAAAQINITSGTTKSQTAAAQVRVLRLIDQETSRTIRNVVERTYQRLEDDTYYHATLDLIERAANTGNVVILGWGAQCILADFPNTLHVRIIKHWEDRINWLKEHFALDGRQARQLIEREEKDSASYIEHYFNRSWDDAHLYHAVLNLSRLTMEEAVSLIVDWARRHTRQLNES